MGSPYQCRKEKIDRKEYYYHYKDKRWKTVYNTTQPAVNSSPPVAAVATPLAASASGSVATSDQSKEVTLATATKQISETLNGLIDKFK